MNEVTTKVAKAIELLKEMRGYEFCNGDLAKDDVDPIIEILQSALDKLCEESK